MALDPLSESPSTPRTLRPRDINGLANDKTVFMNSRSPKNLNPSRVGSASTNRANGMDPRMDSDRLTEEAIAVFEMLTGLESLDLHDGPLGEHEMPDRLGERPA